MPELFVKDLRRSFGKKRVLDGVTFGARSGECVGILGGNGSGKSTLLSILAGILPAERGSFSLTENERSILPGYIPQGTPLIEELSAQDNLRLWYDRKSLKKELEGGVLSLLGIPEFLNVPVRKMSGGMKKRLSIGCAVASHPRALYMDEPTSALDLSCKERIYAYMDSFLDDGGLILLVTHDIREIERCSRCLLLSGGRLTPYVYDGDSKKLAGLLA